MALKSHRIGIVLLLTFVVQCNIALERDPYDVLGLTRHASDSEIKKRYRDLTKEWHPDRNDAPNAAEKFMEIQSAYEVLSDSERRSKYDRTGSLNPHDDIDDAQHFYGNMDDFIRTMMFGQHFGSSAAEAMKLYNQRRMTLRFIVLLEKVMIKALFRMYETTLLAKSWQQPFLILTYADWCAPCIQYAAVWQTLLDDLLPIGYGMHTVNKRLDGTLADKLRVHELPSLVILSDGKTLVLCLNVY